MIDIQLLRNSIDTVAARLRTRGYELDIHAFEKLDCGPPCTLSTIGRFSTAH